MTNARAATARPIKKILLPVNMLNAAPVFEAWTTEKFDRWFAAPGTVMMQPRIDVPYFFEAIIMRSGIHITNGRFLRLELDRLIEMT